jgi:hypothetical protein
MGSGPDIVIVFKEDKGQKYFFNRGTINRSICEWMIHGGQCDQIGRIFALFSVFQMIWKNFLKKSPQVIPQG